MFKLKKYLGIRAGEPWCFSSVFSKLFDKSEFIMALRLPTLHQTMAYSTVKFGHSNDNQPQSYAINNSLTMSSSSSCSTTSSASSSCNDTFINVNSSNTNIAVNSPVQPAQIQLGLMNAEGKYLTAESFGFKINATGNTLRKKQKWTIEQDSDEFVYLISPLMFYLSADKYGKLKCDKSCPDADCKFVLESSEDGKWSFRSATYGYYFAGSNDQLHCFSKTPEWWSVHLAMHPQVNLKHALRKRYARFEDDEMHVDEIIPWGCECLMTIEFENGKYAIRTNSGLYLNRNGKLVQKSTDDTLFSIEFCKGCVAFKHSSGKYLTPVGPQGVVVARSKSITKDELFIFDSSHTQITLIGHNGKYVSVKQGIDMSANQTECNDTEKFQLENDVLSNDKWLFRAHTNKYWRLELNNGIQASGDAGNQNSCFDLKWIKPGHVVICAPNGKYISAVATGHMKAVDDTITDTNMFRICLANRPTIILKCDYGFVGYKNKTTYKLESNRSAYDVVLLEETKDQTGFYNLKGSHGGFWDIGADNNLYANNKNPIKFSIELMANNRLLIKAPNGFYLKGEQNGNVSASAENVKQATHWEF